MTTTTTTTAPTNTWTIDPTHSSVTFSVRHMMVTTVRGEFQKVSGTVTFDPARPEATEIKASVDTSTINTREAQRDGHLKSPDFFDVAKHPTMDFVSRAVRVKGKGHLEVEGDLTLHGVTKRVTLDVEGPAMGGKDPYGKERVGASARTTVKRSDFGMTWNAVVEAGGVVVSDDVKVEIDVSLVR